MVGSRMQQACSTYAEQTAEVVRNGTGGTLFGIGIPETKARNEAKADQYAGAAVRCSTDGTDLYVRSAGHPARAGVAARWEWTRT